MTSPAISDFAKVSILVSLTIRNYGARKEDKKISKKVAADHGADEDSGNYTKHLVPKDALEPVTKAVAALRSFHYENTLPWLDEGVRILPSLNYQQYRAAFEPLRDHYDAAVRDFVNRWPQIVIDARARLGGMFKAEDYPSDVASRFGVTVRFMPLGDTQDFRVQISDVERETLRREIEGTLADAERTATADIYKRLHSAVKHMGERLRAYQVDEDGARTGVFRDSLVENLRELVALVPRLNFTQDAELEAVRALVEGELCGNDAGVLRSDDAVRETTAENAEQIALRLVEFMRDGEAA